MPQRGLIIGKFYPPHAGHHFLIDTALRECAEVTVVVLAASSETLPGDVRANLISQTHGEPDRLRVLDTVDDLEINYSSHEAEQAHADLVGDVLLHQADGWDVPDTLFSSESYGPSFAESLSTRLGTAVTHRPVDYNRVAIPISASAVRRDPINNWNFLSKPTRRHLAKRVVICGAESSGTTALSKALAARYQTVWVPEYGRTFSEALGESHRWTSDDFWHICHEQTRMEDDLTGYGGPVVFCDTDPVATLMFHELYLKQEAPWDMESFARDRADYHHALYVLTDDAGVEFEDDGYRLFADQRRWATEWFEDYFSMLGLNWVKVTGSHTERLARASRHVDAELHWEFGPSGDESWGA